MASDSVQSGLQHFGPAGRGGEGIGILFYVPDTGGGKKTQPPPTNLQQRALTDLLLRWCLILDALFKKANYGSINIYGLGLELIEKSVF